MIDLVFNENGGTTPPNNGACLDQGDPVLHLCCPSDPHSVLVARSRSCPAPVAGQFSGSRYALLFKPGEYSVEVPVGYYTQARLTPRSRPTRLTCQPPRRLLFTDVAVCLCLCAYGACARARMRVRGACVCDRARACDRACVHV